MKIRIAIPVLNQISYLRQCLRSIRDTAPRDHDVSVHVIDNGSHEPIQDALSELGELRFIFDKNKENQGVYRPWNRGLYRGMADECDVICISNSDVIYGPKAIENCALVALERGACFPYSIQGGPLPADFDKRAADAALQPYNTVVDTGGFAGWSFFLNRPTISKVGGFDDVNFKLWFADTCYHWRLANAGIRPLEVRSCLLHHFESVSIRALPQQFEAYGWRAQDEKNFNAKYKR